MKRSGESRSARLTSGGLEAAFEELESLGEAFETFKTVKLSTFPRMWKRRELGARGLDEQEASRQTGRVEELIGRRERAAAWPPGALARRIAAQLGPLGPHAELERLLAEADPGGTVLGRAAHRLDLLLRLAGKYTVQGEWVAAPPLAGRYRPSLLEELTRLGPASLAEAHRALDTLGVPDEYRLPWIESRPGYLLVDGLIWRYADDADRAVVVLHRHGAPLAAADLLERTQRLREGPMRFRERLRSDPRFVLYRRDRYGLAEWGGEPLPGPLPISLASVCALEIERHGGEIGIERLAAILGERFGVEAEQVRAQLPTGALIDEAGETVRWRPQARLPAFSKQPLAYVRGCFRRELGWALRLRLTAAMLRGATTDVPGAFLEVLGRRPGEGVSVGCRPGPLALPLRPAADPDGPARLGGLRAAAEAVGARRADRLFLTIRPLGGLQLDMVRHERCERAQGFERLALECGREPGVDPIRQAAVALGLAPDLPCLPALIAERLGERGERRLLTLS